MCLNEGVKKVTPKIVLARVISRVLDPLLEVPVAIMLAVYVAVSEGIRWRFLGLLLFVDLVVPFVFFLTMLYHKQITSWDVRERRERIPLYFFTMLCHLGGVWLAHELGKTELSANLLAFWLTGMVFAVTTTFWKISLHAGVNAFLITLIIRTMGVAWLPLVLIMPLVYWARIVDKHHTPWQLAAGTILGIMGGLFGLA